MSSARLAGFATRALALVIDIVILDLVTLGVGGALAWAASFLGIELNPNALIVAGLAATGWLVLLAVFLFSFWTLAGQTPGMRYMGIRVTDLRGETPGAVRSLRRLLWFYISAIPLGAGFLLVLVDDRRRGLHDRRARTLVIHAPRTKPQPSDHLVRMMSTPNGNGSIVEPEPSTTKDRDATTP